jgi:hypothetical protein
LKLDKPQTGGEPLRERLLLMPYNAKALYQEIPVERLLSEATMGIEPMVRVLQTLALPLGDVAAR